MSIPKGSTISERYSIGVDISDDKDLSVIMVSRIDGQKMTIVNVFTGAEAEEMYERLTNQKVGVIRDG